MTERPPLPDPINFNAQHAPMGAFMSFTCGHFGTRGGLGLQIGHPSDQNIFVGVKDGGRSSDAPLLCFPFSTGFDSSASDAFLVENAAQNARQSACPFPTDKIQRSYGWCTDEWRAGVASFTIYSPFASIPDPDVATDREMREALLPAVIARLVIDNRQGNETKTGFFSLAFARNGVRPLEGNLGSAGRVAFAFRSECGVAAELVDLDAPLPGQAVQPSLPLAEQPPRPAEGPVGRGLQPAKSPAPSAFLFQRWSPSGGLQHLDNPIHRLGSCPGMGFEVPAGKRYALVIAIGSYLGDVETTRLEGRYFYAQYYRNLGDVLSAALDRSESLIATAEARDRELDASPLSSDQRFIIAHAAHSYYGSTQLLEIGGRPFWIVNEGEYCMMNTLDLSVDQVFWELERNPWVVRNLLDNFVSTYSYVDEVKRGSSGLGPGGISFTHDMGAHNNFSPSGHSAYELPHQMGCFSYMTQEQLCNWVLIAACYVAKTRDTDWLERNRKVIEACLTSMVNRGGEVGFAQYDSARCGEGQEITTYDSLDHSLAQTRNSVYIAVKSWATYRALGLLLRSLRDAAAEEVAMQLAGKVADVVARQSVDGILPAIFEASSPGYASRILPAVEGCVYPLYFAQTGFAGHEGEGIFHLDSERRMGEALKAHVRNLLLDPARANLFDDGGIKLSSTSNNSWMSKIAVFMHVARRVFRLDADPRIAQIFREADRAHVRWQVEGSAYWACTDQIVSGKGQGSRYYPRIVTSALWLMNSV